MPEVSPYVLYLLHFEQPIGAAQHYLGITRRARLPMRMKEHRSGRGAALTKQARAIGVGFRLAAIVPAFSFADERDAKRQGHYARLCPFCTPSLTAGTGAAYRPYNPQRTTRVKWEARRWGSIPSRSSSTS